MDVDLPPEVATRWQRRARHAYELGRLRVATVHSVLLSAVLGAGVFALSGHVPWGWLVVPWLLWTLTSWRGGALLWGGRLGLVAGALTLALPMSLLRPCCRPGVAMGPDCCAMPGSCAAVGALLGLSLAAFLVTRAPRSRVEAAGGMALGVLAVSVLKCPVLFAGEALGLLGGLLGGVAVAAAVSAWWGARTVPGR